MSMFIQKSDSLRHDTRHYLYEIPLVFAIDPLYSSVRSFSSNILQNPSLDTGHGTTIGFFHHFVPFHFLRLVCPGAQLILETFLISDIVGLESEHEAIHFGFGNLKVLVGIGTQNGRENILQLLGVQNFLYTQKKANKNKQIGW